MQLADRDANETKMRIRPRSAEWFYARLREEHPLLTEAQLRDLAAAEAALEETTVWDVNDLIEDPSPNEQDWALARADRGGRLAPAIRQERAQPFGMSPAANGIGQGGSGFAAPPFRLSRRAVPGPEDHQPATDAATKPGPLTVT